MRWNVVLYGVVLEGKGKSDLDLDTDTRVLDGVVLVLEWALSCFLQLVNAYVSCGRLGWDWLPGCCMG